MKNILLLLPISLAVLAPLVVGKNLPQCTNNANPMYAQLSTQCAPHAITMRQPRSAGASFSLASTRINATLRLALMADVTFTG